MIAGKTAVVVEDLISTGGSSLNTIRVLRDAGALVPYCLSLFNYGFANKAFTSLQPPCMLLSLLAYPQLLEIMGNNRYLNEQQLLRLQEWHADPFSWGENHGFPGRNHE